MKWWGLVAVAAGLVALASLLVDPFGRAQGRREGPLLSGSMLTGEARAYLGRACQNCHSYRTEWPWYGHVAPVSWLLARDVRRACDALNFSTWPDYGKDGQSALLASAADDVLRGAMPPRRYLLLHPEARLSNTERTRLAQLLNEEITRLRGGG